MIESPDRFSQTGTQSAHSIVRVGRIKFRFPQRRIHLKHLPL
jgi:hypothetical protein